MSEEQVVIESAASTERQTEALKMGWIPPTRFKGDPEKFIDAEQYIERGEQLLPIVRANNLRLEKQVALQATELQSLRETVSKTDKLIADMEIRHSAETQKKVELARSELKAQLAKASEAGDHEGVAELTDQLTTLNAAEKEQKKEEKKEETPPPQFKPPAALIAWAVDNPWFGTNKKKTALMIATAQEIREAEPTLGEIDLYNRAKAETEEIFTPTQKQVDKVEGSRNGSGGAKGKSYASLPSEAKLECDKDLKKFVGPGKLYKTDAEYRSYYASLYFSE